MRRRAFLALTGTGIAGTLAGCSGDGSGGDGNGSSDDPAAAELGYRPLAEGEPDVTFGEARLVGTDDGFAWDGLVEVLVANEGAGASGTVTLEFSRVDEAGEPVDDQVEALSFLRAGETWRAIIYPLEFDPEVDEISVSGEVRGSGPLPPEGLRIEETTMEEPGRAAVTGIDGTAINRGDDAWTSPDLHPRVFDEQGRVLGDGVDLRTEELAAGEEWEFDLSVGLYHRTIPADYEVVPTRY